MHTGCLCSSYKRARHGGEICDSRKPLPRDASSMPAEKHHAGSIRGRLQLPELSGHEEHAWGIDRGIDIKLVEGCKSRDP